MQASLQSADPAVFASVQAEIHRQQDDLELIASENYVSKAVLETLGSPLTNKYAEGLPNRRYYGGCEFVDEVENIVFFLFFSHLPLHIFSQKILPRFTNAPSFSQNSWLIVFFGNPH